MKFVRKRVDRRIFLDGWLFAGDNEINAVIDEK